ncbi:MAG: universal stress protein [Devosia sp.]|nr:universal stress protein [Devosia sp.]
MDIRTILLNLDVDFTSPVLLPSAVALARRLDAKLVGFAAAGPAATLVPLGATAAITGYYEVSRQEVEARLRDIEAEFDAAVPAALRGNFVSYIDPPTGGLINLASGADLVLIGSHTGEPNYARNVDIGELVLGAGRPVLLVAAGASEIKTGRILVGWKDTKEARRAVVDALPFLRLAAEVVVATISEGDRVVEQAKIADVITWLATHGIEAQGDVYPVGQPAATLADLARLLKADLIVTGGYGHSRVREWFFGGVTQDLLGAPTLNRLMSN